MNLAFDQDYSDLMAFHKHFWKTNKKMRRQRIRVLVLYGILILFSAFLYRNETQEAFIVLMTGFCLLMAVIGVLGFAYMKWFFMRTNRKLISKTGEATFFGPRLMSFDEEGMHLQTDTVDERIKWPGFLKWEETPGYYFLYISEGSAHIIPLAKIGQTQIAELKAILNTHIKTN